MHWQVEFRRNSSRLGSNADGLRICEPDVDFPYPSFAPFRHLDARVRGHDGLSLCPETYRRRGMTTIPKLGVESARLPADNTDLPAGFAALAAVGEKVVGSAARAGADLNELLARHAGFSENISIEAT